MRNTKINVCSLLIALSFSTPTLAQTENDSVQSRILNGEEASDVAKDLLPWQVAMLGVPNEDGKANARCGAVVISDYWVVTAAHCAVEPDMSTTLVAGLTNLPNKSGDVHSVDDKNKFTIIRKVIHPQYSGIFDLDHDIALLKVDRKLTTVAKPIKIATIEEQAAADNAFSNTWNENAYSKANLITSGWGLTEPDFKQPDELMVVKLAGIPDDQCDNGGYPITSSSHFVCADSNNPDIKKDACRGDSGGPLIWQNPNHISDSDYGLRVVGVTSNGPYCHNKENGNIDAQYNGLYTELAEYHSWVEQITGLDLDAAAPADFSVDPFKKVTDGNTSDKVNVPSSSGGSLPLSALLGLTFLGLLRRNK